MDVSGDPKPNSFEIIIRILGNEFLAFKLSVSDFTRTWVRTSIMVMVVLLLAIYLFGPEIKNVYSAIKGVK